MAQYFVAIHSGHHHVQQNEIRARVRVGCMQSPFTGVGGTDVVVLFQEFAQHLDVLWRIVDDQNGGG
jgi:hypothetical protein